MRFELRTLLDLGERRNRITSGALNIDVKRCYWSEKLVNLFTAATVPLTCCHMTQ
uniref:Uncharacterized protein n=1 Tax=Anguilla anguilla TaxID=7936 RepID=A0A0E9V045_ANGAN